MKHSRRQTHDKICSCGELKKEYITGRGKHIYQCRPCNTIKLAKYRFKKLSRDEITLSIEKTEQKLFLLNQALGFKLKDELEEQND